jgi:hypothetical protein
VYRNFDPTPIHLNPLPTRIFGIGFHKTATNSLNAALKILGYDSAHWESGAWAKAIWKEMTGSGRSLCAIRFTHSYSLRQTRPRLPRLQIYPHHPR